MTTKSQDEIQEEAQTLGAFLREQREQKGASLVDVTKSTKISIPVLKAIEEDDYERMPAVAFCRGFYSLYAIFLELDADDILKRFNTGRGLDEKSPADQVRPPLRKSQTSSNYAEPSSISPAAGKTIFTTVIIAGIIGCCWYFSWNPIDYLNNKLMPTSQRSDSQELTAAQLPETVYVEENIDEAVVAPLPVPAMDETVEIDVPSEQAPITTDSEGTTEEVTLVQATSAVEASTVAPYNLDIAFYNNGVLKVTLDEGFVLEKHFTAGKTLQWQVEKSILLDMPETMRGSLRLNGIEIPLPASEDGRRRLSLPEDLLD